MGLKPLLLLAFAGGAVALRGRLGDLNAAKRRPDLHYAPDVRLLRLVCFGQRSTASDLLWLGAIGDLAQDFGDVAAKRRWMHAILGAITSLEPSFQTVYSYGSTYLALIDHHPEDAVALLRQGVARNPADLLLRVELAMAHYTWFKDKQATIETLKPAVADPRCDAITMGFYTSLLVDGREDFAALAQWAPFLDHSNADVRRVAELSTERTKVKIADRAIQDFTTRHGRPPRSKEELREPGLMAREVVDAVVGCVELDVNGKPRFPRYAELELGDALRGLSAWCRQFFAENRRWPTLDEALSNKWGHLPPIPPGKRLAVDKDRVELVDDPAH